MSFTECPENTSLTIDIIGLVGGILISIGPLAQLIKIIRTRKTKDISLKWLALYTSGMATSILYTLYYKIYPILIPGILETIVILSILIIKICALCRKKKKNKNKKKNTEMINQDNDLELENNHSQEIVENNQESEEEYNITTRIEF